MAKFAVRFNQDMKSFHWCDEKEVNPDAEGWETVHTVTTEKAAQKYCDDNRAKLEAGGPMDFESETEAPVEEQTPSTDNTTED